MKLTPQQLARIDRAVVCMQTALAAREVYWAEHNAATTPLNEAHAELMEVLAERDHIAVMFLPDRTICADAELPSGPDVAALLGVRARAHQASCITFRRGVSPAELSLALEYLGTKVIPTKDGAGSPTPVLPHIGLGNTRVAGHNSGESGAPSEAVAAAALLKAGECVSTISNFWTTLDGGGCMEARRLETAATGVLTFLDSCGAAAIPLAALNGHDQYTTVHTTNVAVLSAALAAAVGLPARTVHDIAIAGLLHDVGKRTTSLAVLGKAGKLDDKEIAEMRRHPVEGAKMLAAAHDVPDTAIFVAYEHHMLPDGSGYPAIPRGRTIHLASRIVQLADVYDALGTHRPYRRAMAPEAVRSHMLSRCGTAYEPDLCGVFFDKVIGRTTKPPAPDSLQPTNAVPTAA